MAFLAFFVKDLYASKHDISTAKLISSGLDLDYFLKNMELEMKDYRSVHPNKRSGSLSDDDRAFLKAAYKEYMNRPKRNVFSKAVKRDFAWMYLLKDFPIFSLVKKSFEDAENQS